MMAKWPILSPGKTSPIWTVLACQIKALIYQILLNFFLHLFLALSLYWIYVVDSGFNFRSASQGVQGMIGRKEKSDS